MNDFGKVIVLKEAWILFKKNLNLVLGLIGVYFAYYVLQYVIGYIFQNSAIGSLISFIFIILFLVIQLGAYNLVLKIVDGKKAALSDLYTYSNAGIKVLRNIVAGLIVGFLVVIGLIFFIIPGIYIGVRLMFFTYYIVDKDAGIIDSIKKSWELTKSGVINLFFFGLILLFINFLGMLFFGIGLAITMPLTFLATAIVYRKFQK